MENLEYQLSNGAWRPFPAEKFDAYIAKAVKIEAIVASNTSQTPRDAAALAAALRNGEKVRFGQGALDYLRLAPGSTPDPVIETETADCGHTVATGTTMSTAIGTACADCYDAMSDATTSAARRQGGSNDDLLYRTRNND